MSRHRPSPSSIILSLAPVVMIVAAVLLLLSLRAVAEREILVRHTYEVLDQLHEVQRAYDRVLRQTRRHIHSNENESFAELLRRAADVLPLVAELETLVEDNEGQSRLAEELREAIHEDFDTCRVASRSVGKTGKESALSSMGGLRYGESLAITIMQRMRAEEKALLAQRVKSAGKSSTFLFVTSVLFTLLAISALIVTVRSLAVKNKRLQLANEASLQAGDALRDSENLLREKATQLESLNGELESFSYTVSHDLRAPLRHVNGFIDLLRKRLEPSMQSEGKIKHYLDTIAEAAHRMGQLIDDLLAFARTSRSEMNRSEVAMQRLVGQTIAFAREKLNGHPVTIDVGALPVVQGDENLLSLVWTNLVDNALKYSGGQQEAPRVRITAREVGDEVVFSIADNGIGFDMRFADKLFAVFSRLHADPNYPGTGIGLATVRRIVARHGGRVWAEGRPGEGATFYFSLPREPGENT